MSGKVTRPLVVWLAVVAGIAALAVGAYFLPSILGRHHWESVRGELAARGEKLDAKDYRRPTVPPEQDYYSMPYFQELFREPKSSSTVYAKLKDDLSVILKRSKKGKPAPMEVGAPLDLSWVQAPLESNDANQQAADIQWLEKNIEKLETLRNEVVLFQSRSMGNRRATVEDARMSDSEASVGAIHLALLLFWHSKLALHDNQTNSAFEDVAAIAHLATVLESEPGLFSFHVTTAIGGLMLCMIRNGMHQWNEEQLIALESLTERASPKFSKLAKALREERAAFAVTMEKTLASGDAQRAFAMDPRVSALVWSQFFLHTSWANYEEAMQEYIDLCEDPTPTPAKFKTLHTPSHAYNALERYSHHLETAFLDIYSPYKTFRYQDEAKMMKIAIALERWRRIHGSYPEKLADITPKFLLSIPLGSIAGQTFQYHRFDSPGYLIWSFGWNGTDEGGKHESLSQRNSDWILRCGLQEDGKSQNEPSKD